VKPRRKKAARTDRRVLVPLNTGSVELSPGASAQITARAVCTFAPELFYIMRNPAAWIVHELRINRRPVWNGDVPGGLFRPTTMWTFFVDQIVKRGQEIVLVVTYRGRAKKGCPFSSVIVGRRVRPRR
jgi:hypothetical protein